MPAELQVLHGTGNCGLIMTDELKISGCRYCRQPRAGAHHLLQMHGTARVTCKATCARLVQSRRAACALRTPADIAPARIDNTSDAPTSPCPARQQQQLPMHCKRTSTQPIRDERYATTAQVTQIVTAQAGGLAPVQSVNGQQGAVTITKASIGLNNVADLSPADMPVSAAVAAALATNWITLPSCGLIRKS